MKRSTRRSLWVGGVAILVLGALAYLLQPRGAGLMSVPVRVLGRVVDQRTGQPLSGAKIYVSDRATQEEVEEDLVELRRMVAEYGPPPEGYSSYGVRGTTDAEGRFEVLLEPSFCTQSGPGVERQVPPAFHGARTVLVDLDGYVRTFFPAASGTWRVLDPRGEADPYAIVDALVLRLPPAQ